MTPQVALDTNAYKVLRENNPKVVAAIHNSSTVGLPIIVLGELYFGFENGTKREANMLELRKFLNISSLMILHIDNDTARIFGEIAAELAQIGKPIQQNDIWIAALCKQYSYTLITADKGFQHIRGLDIISF